MFIFDNNAHVKRPIYQVVSGRIGFASSFTNKAREEEEETLAAELFRETKALLDGRYLECLVVQTSGVAAATDLLRFPWLLDPLEFLRETRKNCLRFLEQLLEEVVVVVIMPWNDDVSTHDAVWPIRLCWILDDSFWLRFLEELSEVVGIIPVSTHDAVWAILFRRIPDDSRRRCRLPWSLSELLLSSPSWFWPTWRIVVGKPDSCTDDDVVVDGPAAAAAIVVETVEIEEDAEIEWLTFTHLQTIIVLPNAYHT